MHQNPSPLADTGADALVDASADARPRRARMKASDREEQIVQGAIRFFAENGFGGTTRELAAQLGIVHGAIYRYFPTKESLLERVYQDVFEARFDPRWIEALKDRTIPIERRLQTVYEDYARMLLSEEWVRIFLRGGLAGLDITDRYRAMIKKRMHPVLLAETRAALGLPARSGALGEAEEDLAYVLHGGILFLGIRKWVYRSKLDDDLSAHVRRLIVVYLAGARALLLESK